MGIKRFLKRKGNVIALVKPQYEDQKLALRHKGVVPSEFLDDTLSKIIDFAKKTGWKILGQTASPILGKDGNKEFFIHLN